jgi:hypothetical protein
MKELSFEISHRSGMLVAVEVGEVANHLPAGMALCFNALP